MVSEKFNGTLVILFIDFLAQIPHKLNLIIYESYAST